MKQQEFDYSEVLKMGFKRTDIFDNVFFNQHGYHCFMMKYRIKNFVFDWDPRDRCIELIRYDKNLDKDISANRVGTVKIETMDQLKFMIEFLSSTKNQIFTFPTTEKNINYA